MSRPLRIQYPGAWYHVMNRVRRGQNLSSIRDDMDAFLDLLRETAVMFNLKVSSYCLMPTHYHLLVQTADGTSPVACDILRDLHAALQCPQQMRWHPVSRVLQIDPGGC